MTLKLIIALGAAALLGAPAVAADETATHGKRLISIEDVSKSVRGSFDVYIDGPTRFAFVHTPVGWKFTRQVQEDSPALREAPLQSASSAD